VTSRIWPPPPDRPRLDTGAAAVWRLDVGAARPIEAVLAAYLGVEANSLAVRRAPTGMPYVEASPFRASLAHSGEVTLVAVALEREVGIDVERLRPGVETWALAPHALTPSERCHLETVAVERRSETVLSLWTRKEALLKAVGLGLALDPRLVDLGDGTKLAVAPPELGAPGEWTLAELRLPDHAAALAVRGPIERLELYDARAGTRRGLRPATADHPG
jgi:4'-phosphopantetheinyl transferase